MKKRLKKLSLDIVQRLLLIVYKNRSKKRTNIARTANMSYNNCVLYLDVLETMDFVQSIDGKYKLYSLTQAGHAFLLRLFNQFK